MPTLPIEIHDDELRRLINAYAFQSTDAFIEDAENAIDYSFVVGRNGEFRGVQLQRCCGGPGVWFDTALRVVAVNFGGERAFCSIPTAAASAINELYEPYFTN